MGRTALLRLCLCLLGCFLAAYQVRYSREVFHAKRNYDFVPFSLLPFGNQIWNAAYALRVNPAPGTKLLAVNGRPFTGLTVYLQELRTAGMRMEPFRVTVRGVDGAIRDLDVVFAHCTCGILDCSRIILIYVLPPAFCVLIGWIVAGVWPTRSLAWLFLALMLCLSQYTLIPDLRARFGGFTQMVEVGGWRDWLRVPAVGYESFCRSSWPAWLVLFAARFFNEVRTRRHRILVWSVATPMLVLGMMWTIAAVGWSEDFRSVASLGEWLIRTSAWQTMAGICATVICVSPLGRKWTAAMVALVACAMVLLHWRELGLPTYTIIPGSDNRFHLVEVFSESFLARAFVVATFGCAAIAVYALAHFRTLTRMEMASFLALGSVAPLFCMGLTPYQLSWSWGYWYPVCFPLAVAGLGLLGVAWSIQCRCSASPR